LTNIHRDSIASYIGHGSQVDWFAIAEGISPSRARFNLLQKMHNPCDSTIVNSTATIQQQHNIENHKTSEQKQKRAKIANESGGQNHNSVDGAHAE